MIPCTCGERRPWQTHKDICPIAVAFRFRCPECQSRRKEDVVTHARHCDLKEYQP